MRMRIWKAKLNFCKYLQNLDDDTLAKQVYNEQKRNQFPGLIKECELIAGILNIARDLKDEKVGKEAFKGTVKDAISRKNEEILREKSKKYSKFD